MPWKQRVYDTSKVFIYLYGDPHLTYMPGFCDVRANHGLPDYTTIGV